MSSNYTIGALLAILLAVGCNRQPADEATEIDRKPQAEEKAMDMSITSSAFDDQEMIPAKYTGDGQNISPPLSWTGVPEEADSLALICHDPDAPGGDWIHWVVYDMPAELGGLQEDFPRDELVEGKAIQGVNDFGNSGYGGPAPPPGSPHRYIFTLYAVDGETGLEPSATRDQVAEAIDGKVVAEAQLVGLYQR